MYKLLSITQKFEQGSLQGHVKQDLPSKVVFWKILKHCHNFDVHVTVHRDKFL